MRGLGVSVVLGVSILDGAINDSAGTRSHERFLESLTIQYRSPAW
jgi:hypothetical protein